jgi:pimeloyl-ACP methyl ester carboxylesterase
MTSAALPSSRSPGSAAPLLLLPGMMCDATLWLPQLEVLRRDRQVIVADFGAQVSVAAMASRALTAMDAEAPGAHSVAVAGLSMGAIVALELWRRAPERVAGLALLNTNHRADAADRRSVRDRQIRDARRGGLYWLLRDELKPAYPGSTAPDDELLDTVMAMGLRLGPEVFIAQSMALRDRIDSTATLPGITCPTLVLCGAEDTLCPVCNHQEMAAQIPGAELMVLENCGHLSTLECPAEVSRALQRWLNRVDPMHASAREANA